MSDDILVSGVPIVERFLKSSPLDFVLALGHGGILWDLETADCQYFAVFLS